MKKIFNTFFYIICTLHFICKVKANIRGIPGKDYPNYTSIPKTSFKCSEQQFKPGFYADVETRCQVFHHCYNHRKESFLCPPGTTYNQPIKACDYWYSSECNLSPSYYHLNALNTNKNKNEDFTIAPAQIPPDNLFEKMAALYDTNENSEGSVYLINNEPYATEDVLGYEFGSNVKHTNNSQEQSFEELTTHELNKGINLKNINEIQFEHNKESTDSDNFPIDEQYETEGFRNSEYGNPLGFSLHGNPENAWKGNTDYSYKLNIGEEISSEVMRPDNVIQEQVDENSINDSQYEDLSISQIELFKRLSQPEMSSKINRLRRRPQYVVLQTTEQINSSPGKENHNLETMSTSGNAQKYNLNSDLISYAVPTKLSVDLSETVGNVVSSLPEKPKRSRKPFTILLVDKDGTTSTTVSPLKDDMPVMSSNIFDTYLTSGEIKSSRRKPVLIQDTTNDSTEDFINLFPVTPAPLRVSSFDPIHTDVEYSEDITEFSNFVYSTEVPEFETTTNLNEFSTVRENLSNKEEQSLFHEESFSDETLSETEESALTKFTEEIVEPGIIKNNFGLEETDVFNTELNNEQDDMSVHHSELSESSSEYVEHTKLGIPEFEQYSTFSPSELDKNIPLGEEYLSEISNDKLEEKWIVTVTENPSVEYLEIDDQGNSFSELQTGMTAETDNFNENHNQISNDEMLKINTLSSIENAEIESNQDSFETFYKPEWMDENEFLSLIEISGSAMNDSTYSYELEDTDGLEAIDYDSDENNASVEEFEEDSNRLEEMPYTTQEHKKDDILPSVYQNEHILDLTQNKMVNISSNSASTEPSVEGYTPQNVITESVMPNIPAHLYPIETPQNLNETILDSSTLKTNEDNRKHLMTMNEKLLDSVAENEAITEFKTDFNQSASVEDPNIHDVRDSSLIKDVPEDGNDTMVNEITESSLTEDFSSFSKDEIKKDLLMTHQYQHKLKEDNQTNLETEQNLTNIEDVSQLNSQLKSFDVNGPISNKDSSAFHQPSSSMKVTSSAETYLSEAQFKANGKNALKFGRALPKSQLPLKGKTPLTKTVGKRKVMSKSQLKSMQMLLSSYLSESEADDDSLFASRSGKLFKTGKFSKAIAFGKKLLAMKRAKFNILKRYANSFIIDS